MFKSIQLLFYGSPGLFVISVYSMGTKVKLIRIGQGVKMPNKSLWPKSIMPKIHYTKIYATAS